MEFHVLTFFLFLTTTYCQLLLDPDLPDPRIVIVGPTGCGKSSMANALLGCDLDSPDCLFQVCDGMDSCTKETSYGKGQWLGEDQNFTVVDTPGFADSDGDDGPLIEEMLQVLKETIKHSSTILLVLKGTETRFNKGLQDMLTKMTTIFGEQWWDYTVIGVSFWKLDQASIDAREAMCKHDPSKCKNEEWFIREINTQLQEKFSLQKNISYAFIDSHSQTWPNNEDPIQQQHFKEQADILWQETISRNESIFFKDIDDVLEENAAMKERIKWLEDIITKNISELITRMDANEENDKTQDLTIGRNEDTASTERSLLRKDITSNENTISKVDKDCQEIHEELSEVGTKLTKVTDEIQSLHLAPLGTIIAWVNKPNTDTDSSLIEDLPDGWVKCDGAEIPKPSKWAGLKTPDLNNEKRFLRGGQNSEMLSLEEDMVLDHSHIDNGHSHSDTGHSHTQESHSHTSSSGNEFPVHDDDSDDIDVWLPGSNNPDTEDWYAYFETYTNEQTPAINSANASITSAKSNVSTVDHSKKGHENRPKNMVVTYIMRIY